MNTMTQKYVMFVFIIGAFMALLALPFSGFGTIPSQLSSNINDINSQIKNGSQNAVFTTVHQGVTQTATASINATEQSLATANCIANNQSLLTLIEQQVCNIDLAVHSALISGYCSTFGYLLNLSSCQQNAAQAQAIANQLLLSSPNLFDVSGGANKDISVVSGQNSLLTILDSPVTQAIAVALIFLGLGWLAGTFGAGILANIMARVGIAVALFYFINAQMSVFGSIPIPVMLFVNAIFAVPTILLLWDSFGGGKSS